MSYKIKIKTPCRIKEKDGFIGPLDLFKKIPMAFFRRTATVEAIDNNDKIVYICYDKKCYIIPFEWIDILDKHDRTMFCHLNVV